MTDHASFEDWYRREADGITQRICATVGDRSLGTEAAAEAFARAWERWPRLQRMESPEGWVYRVATNLCKRWWRRRLIERRALERVRSVEILEVDMSAERDALPQSEAIVEAVEDLPGRMRTAVRLRYWDELSEREVADEMNVATGTASAMLSQARARVGGELEARGPATNGKARHDHG